MAKSAVTTVVVAGVVKNSGSGSGSSDEFGVGFIISGFLLGRVS